MAFGEIPCEVEEKNLKLADLSTFTGSYDRGIKICTR